MPYHAPIRTISIEPRRKAYKRRPRYLATVRLKGIAAARAGKPFSSNPHGRHADKEAAWAEGWESVKRKETR